MLGISPMRDSGVPAQYDGKEDVAHRTGQLVMDVLARGQRPRDIITKESLENAIAADVFGSPAYVLDGEVFWGQDRLELLRWRLGA